MAEISARAWACRSCEPAPTTWLRARTTHLYPQTGNGGYDPANYDLNLICDPDTNLFEEGTQTTMTATTTQNLSEFTVDFQDIGVTAVTERAARGLVRPRRGRASGQR